jgi:uncharacterized protein
MALHNQRTGACLAAVVEPAFDRESRNRGLLGRDGLPPGHAIILAPCNSVHTFFMRFTIDVLFVRASGEIVRISPRLRPWRIALAFTAKAVVELPAGAVAESGTVAGDFLTLVAPPRATPPVR